MPGVKLDFLKNTSQRLATNKSLPLKQVEAMLLYGKPQHKAQVAQKIISAAYGLALNKATHHVLLTLIDTSDNLIRVQLLYAIRRKLADLSVSQVGNVVIQALLEKLPKKQRKEIAESFVLNVEHDEFASLCENAFGNHVAQRLFDYTECVEVLMPVFKLSIVSLAKHPFGMRVVAKCIDAVESGWSVVLDALMPNVNLFRKIARMQSNDNDNDGDNNIGESVNEEVNEGNNILSNVDEKVRNEVDEAIAKMFAASSESIVLTSLLRHPQVPLFVKDAICAHACEFVTDYLLTENRQDSTSNQSKVSINASQSNEQMHTKEQLSTLSREHGKKEEEFDSPVFGTAEGKPVNVHITGKRKKINTDHSVKHIHTYVAIFEHGDMAQRRELWNALIDNESESKALENNNNNNNNNNIHRLMEHNDTMSILIAAVKYYDDCRCMLFNEMFKTHMTNDSSDINDEKNNNTLTIVDVATDPIRTLLLRAFIDVSFDFVNAEQCHMLCGAANTLALNPCSSPVLQRMLLVDSTGVIAEQIFNAVAAELTTIMKHTCGSFLIQALMQYPNVGVREKVIAVILESLGLATYSTEVTQQHNNITESKTSTLKTLTPTSDKLRKMMSYSEGSRVLQRLIAYCSDAQITTLVDVLTVHNEPNNVSDDEKDNLELSEHEQEEEEQNHEYRNKENNSKFVSNVDNDAEVTQHTAEDEQNAPRKTRKEILQEERTKHRPIEDDHVIACALHQHGCYCIQSLLRETRSRQLDTERKKLMNELKPYVFELATSPWAGRVVLETMLLSGSATLTEAMRNVIFLRAEQWLSEPPTPSKSSDNRNNNNNNNRKHNKNSRNATSSHQKRSRSNDYSNKTVNTKRQRSK